MEQFIQDLQEEGDAISFEIPFKIDGVKGYLTVEYDEEEEGYNLMFEWNDAKDHTVIVDGIKTPNEVATWILRMKDGSFFGEEPVFTEKRKKWILNTRKLILESENRDPEICYVCFEDTYEYKTPCNHDICYACFVKSIQNRISQRREFVCGICRKKNTLH